jgi:hypothetical protein
LTCTELVEVSRKKIGKMKILAQFGIFIRIIILNIGGKKANTQINYIANQKEHHSKKTFQNEYKAFLKKYEVEYDERYVWD